MAISEKQVEAALRSSGGFISQTAKRLHRTPDAIYKRIQSSEYLKKIKFEIDDAYLDLAESKLIKKMNQEDLGALCFYLKCKGKHRGYVEKQQLEHSGDAQNPIIQKIEIEFIKAK